MFCPQCGAEYREGFGRCVDCEVDLVAEAPSPAGRPAPAARLVTVLRSGDPTVLAMAKSLLQDAGIASAARGEGLQDLFALGRLGTGSSPIVGPAEIRVSSADEGAARALLRDLESGVESPSDDEDDEAEDDEDDETEDPGLAAERAAEPADDAGVSAPSPRAKRVFRALVLCELLVWLLAVMSWEPFARRVPEPLWDQIDAVLPSAIPVNVFTDSYPTFMLLWLPHRSACSPSGRPAGTSTFSSGLVPLRGRVRPGGVGLRPAVLPLDARPPPSGAIIALAFSSPVRRAFARRARPPS